MYLKKIHPGVNFTSPTCNMPLSVSVAIKVLLKVFLFSLSLPIINKRDLQLDFLEIFSVNYLSKKDRTAIKQYIG